MTSETNSTASITYFNMSVLHLEAFVSLIKGGQSATAWVQLRRELVLAFKCIYRIARKVDTDNLTPELSFTVSITHVPISL